MLDGLDLIDWNALGHSLAASTSVPQQLRALLSSEAETRERALDDLYATIHDQGSLYPAALVAVPFLIALVAEPTAPCRLEVLTLLESLGSIAVVERTENTQEARDRARYPVPEWLRPNPSESGKVVEQQLPAQVIAAVGAGTPVFVEILENGTDELRLAALNVLWTIPDASPVVLPTLRRLLETTEDTTHYVHLLVSLSFFTGHDEWFVRICDRLLVAGGSPEVCEAAAVARLSMSPPWSPSTPAARVVASALTRQPYLDCLGSTYYPSTLPLRFLRSEEQLRLVATMFVEALPASQDSLASTLAMALVEILSGAAYLPLVRGPAFVELRLQALKTILAKGPPTMQFGPNGEAAWHLYLYVLLCMVFIDDAHSLTGSMGNVARERSAILQQVLDDALWSTRSYEVLEIGYYLLSAYLGSGTGGLGWPPSDMVADLQAIIQTLLQSAYWETDARGLGALLRHFGLPDTR